MNKNFTLTALVLCFLLSVGISSQAQTSTLLRFTASPQLLSGQNNGVNSSYRFANVKTGTDAIVTIVSATGGATVQILDDNNITKPEAFSPSVKIRKNTTGKIEFRIDYVVSGTLTPQIQDSLYATAIDVDGATNLYEVDEVDLHGGVSSYMSSNPEITVSQNGTKFTGTNLAGIDYPSIDTSARQVMFTVRHNNVSSFTYICGAINNSNSDQTRQKSLYFKDFVYPAGGALPLKYLSFDAVINNNSVLLKWLTTQEVNNSHFEVERSFDMNSFSTLGLVLDGFPVNNTDKSYQFKDNSAELQGRSIVYYRLKQFDIDGNATYSKVLVVRLQAKANVIMQVSPNPFVENLNVRFSSVESGTAQIRIMNVFGQTLLSKQSTISKGYNNIQVDGLNRLVSGMYVAQLIMNGTVIDNQRVIKNTF